MTIEDTERLLKAAEAYKEIKLLDLQRVENYIAKLQRDKWWLEHPEVAYFTARVYWETERWTLESYLSFYVDSVFSTDGLEIDFDPLYFNGFQPLEAEVTDDDDTFITYRNPYATTISD